MMFKDGMKQERFWKWVWSHFTPLPDGFFSPLKGGEDEVVSMETIKAEYVDSFLNDLDKK